MYEDQIHRALGVFEHKNNVREHYFCVKQLFDLYNSKEALQKLADRPDIDTMCSWDYARMKNFALQGKGLHVQDYHPESQGIQVPKWE